jgi:hypothetical protein
MNLVLQPYTSSYLGTLCWQLIIKTPQKNAGGLVKAGKIAGLQRPRSFLNKLSNALSAESSVSGTRRLQQKRRQKLTHEERLDNAEDTLLQEGEEAEEGVVGSEQPQEDPEEAGLAASSHHLTLLLFGQPRGLHFSLPFPVHSYTVKKGLPFSRPQPGCH